MTGSVNLDEGHHSAPPFPSLSNHFPCQDLLQRSCEQRWQTTGARDSPDWFLVAQTFPATESTERPLPTKVRCRCQPHAGLLGLTTDHPLTKQQWINDGNVGLTTILLFDENSGT